MEELEYSVEISDRDWDCFFAECEECNLLPASLAGVDDSGMSDIDDTGSILAKRVQKVDLTAGFSEADCPVDGPPHCEGSPVEYYLSKHAVGGMESVLSGSEEDIHLQSVNIFFEKLKNLSEAERLAEPSQLRNGKNRDAAQEKGRCSDGQQASSSSLPKNIPKLNSLPASGETAVGKETTESVNTISNINTMKKDVPGSNISPEPAASNLVLKTNKPAYPEMRLFIREETCTETTVQLNQSHDAPEGLVCSETTPDTNKVIKVEMSKPPDGIKQEDVWKGQSTPGKKCGADSSSNQEVVTHVKRKQDQIPDVVQSEAACTNKTASQESSPSASIKRKRRKKRRLSVEPAESVHGYERQVLVKQSDSEEERRDWRGAASLCLSEDIHLSCLKEAQKDLMSSLMAYSFTSQVPVKITAKEMKVTDLSNYSLLCNSQYLPESAFRNAAAENNQRNNRSVIPLSLSDDSVVMSASNNSGNMSTNSQPSIKLHVEESADLPVSSTESATGEIDRVMEMTNSGGKVTLTGSHQQGDKVNHSVTYCKNEQNAEFSTAEVKSVASAESNDPTVEVSQHAKLSAAKSVLAAEAGNAGRDNHIVCHREAEPQQQLEIDCQDTERYRSTLEETHLPLSASSSDTHIAQPEHFDARSLEEISGQVGCAKLTDTRNALPDKHCPSCSDINVTAQQTDPPLVLLTSPKFDALLEKNTTNERTEVAASQIMSFQSGNPFLDGGIGQIGKDQRETKSSMSEELLTGPSDITSVSSRCTLDTDSVMSLSNENITDILESSYSSVTGKDPGDQGEKTLHAKGDGTSDSKGQSESNDARESKCDLVVKAGDITAVCKEEHEPAKSPESKSSVFAVSSFWSEMEKLTINDILGLRLISKAAPTSNLPPLPESEEAHMLAMTDSGIFTQLDESKPEHTDEDTCSDPYSADSSSASVTAVDSLSSRGVMWESLGADNFPENRMLTSVRDTSQPVLTVGAQTCLKKISKNVSVHNLHALESQSFSYTRKGQTLQTLDEGDLKEVKYFTEGHMPKQDIDVDTSLSKDSYRISLTDIFQYLLGTKQSVPSQSATDNINTFYTDGNSVAETYHHFFSEFDTESFFYPLIAAEDKTKDETVPIFSCSRSVNRNLQFPEAYDHFFASSSSDDSSSESDEEDSRGPVRVVTRFTRTSSTSQLSKDIYENFFTDGDLRQNFFWKSTLSFRNISLTGAMAQKQVFSNPVSRGLERQSGRSIGRTAYPINALGNQDMKFPDPLLINLQDRMDTQLAQQPFRYEDLQSAVSNPRLDASFLPLRQSDMCLVCIAFASWVLKTANPQVGDTWKAVLLANVSALSAIRYLRKYVKKEAAAGVKKLDYTAPSDS